jgi:hypothetical protein
MKNNYSNFVSGPSVFTGAYLDTTNCDNQCCSYLGAWFEALKHSPHYMQTCRSGLFNSEASFKTYEMFGSVEDLNFEQWWASKGLDEFGYGCIKLEEGYEITYESIGSDLKVTLSLPVSQPTKVIGIDGLALALNNKFRGLLSDKPVMWPFFKAKISPYAISKSLQVVKACQSFAKAGKFKMWEIGEQLNLKKASISQPGDWRIDLTDNILVWASWLVQKTSVV